MCGILGILTHTPSSTLWTTMFQHLSTLRHRGTDGVGIAVDGQASIQQYKNIHFEPPPDSKQSSCCALGHVRYRTDGFINHESCQPFVSTQHSFAMVHNGHIDKSPYEPDSLWLFSFFESFSVDLSTEHLFAITKKLLQTIVDGAYSCIVMIHNVGLLAFRDARGIRPLVYHHNHERVILASENTMFSDMPTDVLPGQVILFHQNGQVYKRQLLDTYTYTPCLFEYIYFAHHSATINGLSVQYARQLLGQLLAKQLVQTNHTSFDLIVPVPKTSCISAKELSKKMNIPYEEVIFVRNSSSHILAKSRSFIMPREELRERLIKEKFLLNSSACHGKRILLVDDSIVRGNTMKALIRRFRAANVSYLAVASCAPPVVNRNVYGIDIASKNELIYPTMHYDAKQVAQALGADHVFYQNLLDVQNVLKQASNQVIGFECSMFQR